MDVLVYEDAVNPAWWLNRIAQSDWIAGQYLHTLLTENRFHKEYGDKARLLLLADGTKLAAFCTYAEKDDIPDTELTPWTGFVYTFPDYRGRRLMGKLLTKAKELARKDGYDNLYLSTREKGLYEKYGAVYMTTLRDNQGEESDVFRLETYGYYGREVTGIQARIPDYPGIVTPKDLYRALWPLWVRETCAPRMQEDWDETNRTLGQCSITAFLAQDIFGGRVFGVPLEDGGYHCFNVVDGKAFDLTSEQFGGRQLDYSLRYEQLRHDHFMKAEKKERYEALREALKACTTQK